MENTRNIEVQQRAQELLENVRKYSLQAANGDHEGALSFLHTFVPSGQDEGPRIRITNEILKALSPREALALELAHHFCGEFNREFGRGSGCEKLLDWDNQPFLSEFFQNLGKAIHGILITSEKGLDYFDSMMRTNQAIEDVEQANRTFIDLCSWADEQLATSRV